MHKVLIIKASCKKENSFYIKKVSLKLDNVYVLVHEYNTFSPSTKDLVKVYPSDVSNWIAAKVKIVLASIARNNN